MRLTLTSTEYTDPLEFFNSLEAKRKNKSTYPGTTPPRNVVAPGNDSLDTSPAAWLNRLPSHTFLVNGQPQTFYTVGAIALALGKTAVTIRSWEAKGWLPKAKFRTPPPRKEQIPGKAIKGKRLYSKDQIMFIVEAYERFIVIPKNPNWDGFRTHIANHYPNT